MRLIGAILGDAAEAAKESVTSIAVNGLNRVAHKAGVDPTPYQNLTKNLDAFLQIFQTNDQNDIVGILSKYDPAPLASGTESSDHKVEFALRSALNNLKKYTTNLSHEDRSLSTSTENAPLFSHQLKSVLIALTIHYLNDDQQIDQRDVDGYPFCTEEKIQGRFNRQTHLQKPNPAPLTELFDNLLQLHEAVFENRHTDNSSLDSLLRFFISHAAGGLNIIPYQNIAKDTDTILKIFETNDPKSIVEIFSNHTTLACSAEASEHRIAFALRSALNHLKQYTSYLSEDEHNAINIETNAPLFSHQIKSVLIALTIHYLNENQQISQDTINSYQFLNDQKIGDNFNRQTHINKETKNPLTDSLDMLLQLHETTFENRNTDCGILYSLLRFYPILAGLPALQREMTNNSNIPLSSRIARGILLSFYSMPDSEAEAPKLSEEEHLKRFEYNIGQLALSVGITVVGLILTVLAIGALLSSIVLYATTGISLMQTTGVFIAMTSFSMFTFSVSCYLLVSKVTESAKGLIRLDPEPVKPKSSTLPTERSAHGWYSTAKKPFNYTWEAIMQLCPI